MSVDARDLERTVTAFVRGFGLLRSDVTPCGLSLHVSEAHALLDLNHSPDMTQQQLTERLCLQKSTVSRLVSQLVDRGWVERRPHPTDGRSQALRLTAAGDEVVRRVERARTERFETLIEALPATDRASVIRSVGLLADAAHTTAATAVQQ